MIYYLETNIVTILISLLILYIRNSKNETSQIIFNTMLKTVIVFCFSDIFAYLGKGHSAFIVEISNIIYFLLMALGSYLWFLFVIVKLEYTTNLKRAILLTSIPLVVLSMGILLNPISHFFFSIDSANIYHRGPGVILTWIVEWSYLFGAFFITIYGIRKETSFLKKLEYKGYLWFVLPMAVAAACQMFFYGTTTTQIGFIFALLMVFLHSQQSQILKDELTDLNNKNAFIHQREILISKTKEITILMIDVNNFKTINDEFGHLIGDRALKELSTVLIESTESYKENDYIPYRYGGDEFVIIGRNTDQNTNEKLVQTIHQKIEAVNIINNSIGYSISISCGWATGKCQNIKTFDALLEQADQNMYKEKIQKSKVRT